MLKFRPLKANEIDCKVKQVTDKGVLLLLYKDARVDQAILDETVGPFNWQRRHTRDNANCIVSIWDADKKQWVEKEDTGTESNTEAEKGLASDSFKRACFNWGIGRELYTAPFTWIPADKCRIVQGKNGKPACYDKFEVTHVSINDGCITALEISNKGRVVFSWGSVPDSRATASRAPESVPEVKPVLDEVKIRALKNAIEARKISKNGVLQYYKKESFEELTYDEWLHAMQLIDKNFKES